MTTPKLALAALLSLGTLGAAANAAYPEQPIQLIVPYAGGGAADQMARRFAKSISETLSTPVVVVNKPGGNTVIGTDLVVKDKPDGYKLLMVTNTNVVLNPLIYQKLPYDADKDLKTISINVEAPLVVLANNNMPFKTLGELQRYGQQHPGKLNYSSASATGPLSLTVEKLKKALDFGMEPIAYSGGAPALMAVMGGEVQVGIDAFSGSLPSIRAGKVRALAVTSEQRLEVMPDIPTAAETSPGFKGSVWYGFAVRAGTPPDIQEALKAAIDKAALDPDLNKTLTEQGLVVFKNKTQAEIDRFIAEDREGFEKIIREQDIKL